MRDGDFWSELDLEPSRSQLVRIEGLKRGVGRAYLEYFELFVLRHLLTFVHHSLLPASHTWKLAANIRRNRAVRECDLDVLEDARANRVGLFADRLAVEEPSMGVGADELERRRAYRPKNGTWEWFRHRHCSCPCCCAQQDAGRLHVAGLFGGQTVVQSRWHMLTECSPSDEAIGGKRAEAAGWLSRHLARFGTRQAAYALTALSGGAAELDEAQRWHALRFILGLADVPADEESLEDRVLLHGYFR